MRTVAGVLLAAGKGRRFGRPKALVEVGGHRLVEQGVALLAAGGCEPVLVVLGAAAAEVERTAALGEAVVVVNRGWHEGMAGSLRAGLAEAERRGASAALVMPVDQPVMTRDLVARLIEAWSGGARVARAAYAGQGRTPVVIDRSLWPAVAATAVGDGGARELLRQNPMLGVLVDCDDVGASCDIDTPRDLRAIERRYGEWLAAAPPERRSSDWLATAHGDCGDATHPRSS